MSRGGSHGMAGRRRKVLKDGRTVKSRDFLNKWATSFCSVSRIALHIRQGYANEKPVVINTFVC